MGQRRRHSCRRRAGRPSRCSRYKSIQYADRFDHLMMYSSPERHVTSRGSADDISSARCSKSYGRLRTCSPVGAPTATAGRRPRPRWRPRAHRPGHRSRSGRAWRRRCRRSCPRRAPGQAAPATAAAGCWCPGWCVGTRLLLQQGESHFGRVLWTRHLVTNTIEPETILCIASPDPAGGWDSCRPPTVSPRRSAAATSSKRSAASLCISSRLRSEKSNSSSARLTTAAAPSLLPAVNGHQEALAGVP